MKLDEGRVRWIVRQRRKGEMTDAQIAQTMKVSASWVRRLWRRFEGCEPKDIKYPARMGRPNNGITGRREQSAVLSGRHRNECGARGLEDDIEEDTGLHVPHNTIHKVLAGEGMAEAQPKKGGQRKWVRFERTYSNTMWHADYKRLDDGRWFIAYMDDASRFITGFGVFEEATGKHALEVLGRAVAKHGRPASILTDHGSQFYANESESRKRGETEFEKELARLDIRHVLARINHPQTNGKLQRFHGELQRFHGELQRFHGELQRFHGELQRFHGELQRFHGELQRFHGELQRFHGELQRFHGELQRRLPRFIGASHHKTVRGPPTGHVGDIFHPSGPTDPVARLIKWYNYDRKHMSLKKRRETPARAFLRKMPPPGAKFVADKQTGEQYRVG